MVATQSAVVTYYFSVEAPDTETDAGPGVPGGAELVAVLQAVEAARPGRRAVPSFWPPLARIQIG